MAPDRTITLHAFASVKGGVGKTTLAIACAKILARLRRVPVLVDAEAEAILRCYPWLVAGVPRHGEGHAIVWSALKQGSRAEKAAGIHGDRLKYMRTQADYEVYANLRLPHDAQRALETAEMTIRSLRHLAGEQG